MQKRYTANHKLFVEFCCQLLMDAGIVASYAGSDGKLFVLRMQRIRTRKMRLWKNMLYIAKVLRDLNFGALMEVYREGNLENAQEFWPELPQGQGILRAEQEFYQYLREDFFSTDGAVYALWQENEKYISALRLEPYRDGLLLEALETAPEYRRRGYAGRLILAVLSQLQPKKVYSHVSKQNTASLSVHEKCGFQRILDYAVYIDGSVNQRAVTMCYEHK